MELRAAAGEPIPLVAPVWRFPDARPEVVKGEWWVACGRKKESVVPMGVFAEPGWKVSTRTLSHSLLQVLDDLRMVAVDLAPDEQAEHLARHVAHFGMPDLCEHGLPRHHPVPDVSSQPLKSLNETCRRSRLPGRQMLGVKVLHVVRFVNFLDALTDACELLGRRRNVRARVVEDLLAFPLLAGPPHGWRLWPAQPAQTNLNADQVRDLVKQSLSAAMEASGVDLATTWASKQRPQLTLSANTNVGLYVLATVARIGMTSQDEAFTCSFCHQSYTPKRPPRQGEQLSCQRPECQKRRRASNQRIYVARKK